MSARRYIYKTDCDGNVRALPLGNPPKKGLPESCTGTFHERCIKAYAELESNGQLRGPFPKGFVKRVHETAIARGE